MGWRAGMPRIHARKWVIVVLVAALGTLGAAVPYAISGMERARAYERWPRLARVDPTLTILREPRRLLEIARREDCGGRSCTQTERDDEVLRRLEAVRGLLALQKQFFGGDAGPNGYGIFVDHETLGALEETNGLYSFFGTVADRPDQSDNGALWPMELVSFTPAGQVARRCPYYGGGDEGARFRDGYVAGSAAR